MQPVPQYGSSSADQAYEQPPTGLQADVSLAMLPIAVGAPHYADWSPVSEPVYATVFCIFCLHLNAARVCVCDWSFTWLGSGHYRFPKDPTN